MKHNKMHMYVCKHEHIYVCICICMYTPEACLVCMYRASDYIGLVVGSITIRTMILDPHIQATRG